MIYCNFTGCEDFSCHADTDDLQVCKVFTKEKPSPAPAEFLEVADIILLENNQCTPECIADALNLYFDLLQSYCSAVLLG